MMDNSFRNRHRPQTRRPQPGASDPHARAVALLELLNRQKRAPINAFAGNEPLKQFNLSGGPIWGERPTRVRINGHTKGKHGRRYTYQLVDGNGLPVRGYKVKEHIELISVEGDQIFGKFKDNKSFVGTNDGTFKDDVNLPPDTRISPDTKMTVTGAQTFTVRGPDGVEFDLDTVFTHKFIVSDGKVRVETTTRN